MLYQTSDMVILCLKLGLMEHQVSCLAFDHVFNPEVFFLQNGVHLFYKLESAIYMTQKLVSQPAEFFFFPFKGVCRFAQCAVYLNTWVIVASVVSEGALFMSLVLPVATVDWSKSNFWRLYISKKAFFFKHIMISWWPFFGLSLFGGRACQNCLFWTKFNLHLIIRSLQKALRFQKFHPSPHAFFLSYLLK